MARKRVKRPVCPNCGHPLSLEDNFCARCGQENHTHKLPIRHFLVELLSGLFNFDTNLLRTLRDLFWPPGLVIREYNANKRARYVPPLRLYLFTSVLFFIFLSWNTRQVLDPAASVVISSRDGVDTSGLTLELENGTISDSSIIVLSSQRHLTNDLLDSTLIASGETPTTLMRAVLRLAVGMSGNSLRKDEFIQGMLGGFSKLLFLLVPFFALLLKLLYRRSGKFYSEHLVFALYFHTVLFLVLGIALLIGTLVEIPSAWMILAALPLIYLFLAIRTVHGDPHWKTLYKTLLLVLGYGMVLVLGFAGSAVIGALSI